MICGTTLESEVSWMRRTRSLRPGTYSIVADAQQRARFGLMHRHRLDHDQAGAALRVADIAIGDVLVDEAVLAGQPRHHGRHHHAIGDDHPGDVQRLEQFHGTWPSRMRACNLAGGDLTQFTAKNFPGRTDRELLHDREALGQFELRDVAAQQEGS